MTGRNNNTAILLFLALTILFSALFWNLIIRAGHVTAGDRHYVEGLMWCPALAALATIWIRRLDVNSLGLSRFGGKYALAGYLLPLAYALIAHGLIWALGLGFFPDPAGIAKLSARLSWHADSATAFVPLYFILMATTGMVAGTARALGEEIGWRGFLALRLVGEMGFTGGALAAGAIWAFWHLPLLLFADYNNSTPWWFGFSCFAVMVIASSVILTWLRLRSASVWPCALFHASHNLFIQAFFTPLTGAKGPVTAYVIDEFGIAVPLVTVGFAVFFWLKRGEIKAS
jgi:uncharacterized protein